MLSVTVDVLIVNSNVIANTC